MMNIKFQLNNRPITVNVPPDRRVIDLLRDDLGLTGTKEGCGSGECGACSILVNGTTRLSCLMLAPQLNGCIVETIEGLTHGDDMNHLQEAFVKHGAVQCGFCTPGMIITATDLLRKNPHPSRDEIRQGISGNLCRCTGYQKIVDAIDAAAENSDDEAVR
jgi:aerobic-type carbon monoxide dehydrogenase small subunit (CoxS/CutS family)